MDFLSITFKNSVGYISRTRFRLHKVASKTLSFLPKSTYLISDESEQTWANKKRYTCVSFWTWCNACKNRGTSNVWHWNMLLRSGCNFQPHFFFYIFYQEHKSFHGQHVEQRLFLNPNIFRLISQRVLVAKLVCLSIHSDTAAMMLVVQVCVFCTANVFNTLYISAASVSLP